MIKMDFEKIDELYQDISYGKKHSKLTLDEWQVALRRQFAENNPFKIENLGDHPVFSDFLVTNPVNNSTYKVSVRDCNYEMNYCSCNDFRTNNLGTCKHVEAVLLHIRKSRKLKKFFKPGHQMPYTSVYLKYTGSRSVRIRIGSENSEAYTSLAKKYFDNDGILLQGAAGDIGAFIAKARMIDSRFRCYPDALEFIIEQRERNIRRNIVGEHYLGKLDNGVFRELIKTELFPYQKQGILFAFIAGKALIADDMGLGKTIQAIAGAEMMRKELGITNVLIVCPTSLKYQWKSEIEKFTASSVFVIEGPAWKRADQYKEDAFYKIVSYHTLANDLKNINENAPDLVILDEAQRIKNFKTKISRSVKKIRSDYSFVLTGTPLENRLEELYSIVQFLDPFKLGPYHQFLDEHQTKDETGKVTGFRNLNRIGETLSDMMIRRKKTEVLSQLPQRMDKILFVSMTEEQWIAHDEYKYNVSRLIAKWHKLGFLPEPDRQKLMIFLNSMRMLCDSTYILDQETRHDTKVDEVMNILDEMIGQGDEKAVVFSQWERMTRLVAKELDKRGIVYRYLHGGVPSKAREELFTTFNADKNCRVFLSTDAGGVGLNLQAASLLVNLDIPWNPAVLEQRISRIYRMGQKRKVNVINLVSSGTIEHRMLDVINIKSLMAAGVLDGGEDSIFIGTSKFKKFMETVEKMVDTPTHAPEQESVFEEPGTPEDAMLDKDEMLAVGPAGDSMLRALTDGDEEEAEKEEVSSDTKTQEPAEVLQMGINFLGSISKILSDKESTEKFVSSIVQKDSDGKSYLKIPVESEKVVTDILGMIGGLFRKN